MKIKKKRYEFNIYLSQEDRKIVDELMANSINVSQAFKIFIRQYLIKIKKINENN